MPALPLLAALALLAAAPCLARQDPEPIRRAVEEFLRVETRGLPGTTRFTVGALDPNNQLPPCGAFDVSLPAGARAWGRTHVSVRCQAADGWSVFVPVHVRVVADYLVVLRPLTRGQVITAADLARRQGDLTAQPAGILTDPAQAVGRTVLMAVATGRPLRADMIREPVVVQQNQTVQVVSRGPGFQVANEGRALNQATAGQVVRVRLANGQVVNGIASAEGTVEVSF